MNCSHDTHTVSDTFIVYFKLVAHYMQLASDNSAHWDINNRYNTVTQAVHRHLRAGTLSCSLLKQYPWY